MQARKIVATLSVLYLCCSVSTASVIIHGQLHITSEWRPIIFASSLNNLQELYHCSDQLIVARAPIDDNGFFTLHIEPIEKTQLIRLHVSKMADPDASLIIGGLDENHGFFGISDGETYHLTPVHDQARIFQHFAFNDRLNQNLAAIDQLVHEWQKEDQSIKNIPLRDSKRNALINRLEEFSDTCNQFLPSLYALFRSDMGFNSVALQAKYQALAQKSPAHRYIDHHRPVVNNIDIWLWVAMIPLIGLLGFFTTSRIIRYRFQKKVSLLSPQELKVANLLINGKSNKEISHMLHVELSTVKSHIYRIFNKLEIRSRKEIKKFSNFI